MDVLYFCPLAHGGIADYTHHQANALAEAGAQVAVLCQREFRAGRGDAHYTVLPCLPSGAGPEKRPRSRVARLARAVSRTLGDVELLVRTIREAGPGGVLMSYSEVLAPLWAPRLRVLRDRGVRFGVVAHDPVRDAVVGPRWWHERSIRSGYSFVDEVFVHSRDALEPVSAQTDARISVIPHGVYAFPRTGSGTEGVRKRLDLPEDAPVLLSFGHLRNAKNLHLVLEAMQRVPEVYLVVAGAALSERHHDVGHYREIARTLGVAPRCRWVPGFVPASEVGEYFAVADLLTLTYGRSFRSASGVLSAAVRHRLPVIASSGGGPLEEEIAEYRLGVHVRPDSAEAIAEGLMLALRRPTEGSWERYETDHSWSANAAIVLDRLFESAHTRERD